MKPLVSVIIPIYNVADLLEKSVNSVIGQIYDNLEIILVDDGSTDECPEICDRFAQQDRRIRVIHKENGGLVSARMAGMEIASGDYVANVDGDDWIDADMISVMVETAINTNADMVSCGYREEGMTSRVQYDSEADYRLDDQVRREIIIDWMNYSDKIGSQLVTKLIRREIAVDAYRKVPASMCNGEDRISFLHYMSVCSRIVSIPQCFYHYLVRFDSLSHCSKNIDPQNRMALLDYMAETVRKLYPFIEDSVIYNWKSRTLCSYFRDFVDNRTTFYSYYKLGDLSGFYDKKVILYGAGKVGQSLLIPLSMYENIEIVAWVDKNYMNCSFPYRKVQSPKLIREAEYDYIIVAVKAEEAFIQIAEELAFLGVDRDKLIWEIYRETINEFD